MGRGSKEDREIKERIQENALAKTEQDIEDTEDEVNPYEDPNRWEGLNRRQRTIVRYKMRGLSQKAIADALSITQPLVSMELSKIRKMQKERVASIDQNLVVGESLSVYEDTRDKGYALYTQAQQQGDLGAQAKALSVIMSAQKEQNKLLMELGILQRAAKQHNHNVKLPPLMEDFHKNKHRITATIIDTQLTELEDPEPPMLEADFDDLPEEDTEE